ncbi:MAG: alpha/beta hydrolase [Saprospiraceae bacterium]|nr:alpha/beta hydrolase [Saprospiraceae bacterium]
MPPTGINYSSENGKTPSVLKHKKTQPKAVIAFIHGFGEHSGRYNHVADFFNQNQYAVIAFDIRGHGKSDGKRGHVTDFDTYLNDIQLFIEHIKTNYKNTPLLLWGHSMGGNLVLNYILRRKPTIKGAVVTGPWIQLAFEPKPILVTLGKLMRRIYPTFTQASNLTVQHISTDPAVVKAYQEDPLVHTQISASAGMGLQEAAAWLHQFSGEMPTPLLIMHGADDKITAQPASEAFSKRVKGDVTYKKWADMYHEIHNEPDKEQVLEYALGWLDAQLNDQ